MWSKQLAAHILKAARSAYFESSLLRSVPASRACQWRVGASVGGGGAAAGEAGGWPRF